MHHFPIDAPGLSYTAEPPREPRNDAPRDQAERLGFGGGDKPECVVSTNHAASAN